MENSFIPKMIKIPGGTFLMGSEEYDDEKPVHRVTVSDFYLAETPVTFNQYDHFCEQAGQEKPDDEGWGRHNRPVMNVSWYDAQAYCQWLSKQTSNTYRLPTEAEWEYAAGGGVEKPTKWAGTDNKDTLPYYAWYYKNSGNSTQPVGRKIPNKLGLFDMSGNVVEWCEDDWHETYKGAPQDGSAWVEEPERDPLRVYRGSSWFYSVRGCRVAFRYCGSPVIRNNGLGFRVAR